MSMVSDSDWAEFNVNIGEQSSAPIFMVSNLDYGVVSLFDFRV